MTKPRVLLTGFGPFPGVRVNASGVLARRLAVTARRQFGGLAVTSAQVPTEWLRGPRYVQAVWGRVQPDLVLHFGVSSKAEGFVIERQGANACPSEPDGAGQLPPFDVLEFDGPNARRVSVPVAAIVKRLKGRGLPTATSNDAGGYLCNAVLFQSLKRVALAGNAAKVGFIHIPASLVGAGADGLDPLAECPLSWDSAIEGGVEIISACLDGLELA
jgi:pyroglutamyl-peptidase